MCTVITSNMLKVISSVTDPQHSMDVLDCNSRIEVSVLYILFMDTDTVA